jgi:cation transport ATPase
MMLSIPLPSENPDDAEARARHAEFVRQQRLILFGSVFTLPLFVLSMLRHFMHDVDAIMRAFPWLMWAGFPYVFGILATPVLIVLGRQYFVGAYKSLRQRHCQYGCVGGNGRSLGISIQLGERSRGGVGGVACASKRGIF